MPFEGRERDRCARCDRVWYDNAKPCAGAIVVSDGGRWGPHPIEAGHILLVRRTRNPFAGAWDVPGGFLEADEHPAAGACRECFEETGLTIAATGLIGIYMDRYEPSADPSTHHHSLNIFYSARPVSGVARPSAEASEVAWFPPAELPPMSEIAFENGRRALRDWLAMRASG